MDADVADEESVEEEESNAAEVDNNELACELADERAADDS